MLWNEALPAYSDFPRIKIGPDPLEVLPGIDHDRNGVGFRNCRLTVCPDELLIFGGQRVNAPGVLALFIGQSG